MKLDYTKPELAKLGTISDLTGATTSGSQLDATLPQGTPVSVVNDHRGS